MESVRPTLPEFNPLSTEPEASPIWRSDQWPVPKLIAELDKEVVQYLSRAECRALRRRPRGYPAFSRSRIEIAVRFRCGDSHDFAFRADLSVNLAPEKNDRTKRVRRNLATLSTFVVRVEHESGFVESSHKDDACGRFAGSVGRRQHHRVGIGHFRLNRGVEPIFEENIGILRRSGFLQRQAGVLPSQVIKLIADIQSRSVQVLSRATARTHDARDDHPLLFRS